MSDTGSPRPWDPHAGDAEWARASVAASGAATVEPHWGHEVPWVDVVAAPEAWVAVPQDEVEEVHPFAGFWRRAWGVYVDAVVVNAWLLLANLILLPIVWFLLPAAASCNSISRCDLPTSVAWGLPIGNLLINAAIVYFLIPRRIGFDGATLGMRQLGLQLSDAESGGVLGPGTAVMRTVVAGALQLVPLAVAGFLVWLGTHDTRSDLSWTWVSVGIGVVTLVFLLPTLWSLVDRQRRTLYDRIAGSVVYAVRPVSWEAVGAFACVFLVPLWPVAILLGHLARARIHREHGHLAGRGLATASLIVGYVLTLGTATVAITVALVR